MNTTNFSSDQKAVFELRGEADRATRFIEELQLLDVTLWTRFVAQFREDADYDAGWRGEYWGKMMRGACFVYSYTKNPRLYAVLEDTVRDMITCADENGRISTYAPSHEFDGWDMWCRKYVLLGMQYFFEICQDEELKDALVASMEAQLDYIMTYIGRYQDGKIPITKATRHWRGLNSSSVLEPVVRLYRLTGKREYLDFASYIIAEGGTDLFNIFAMAQKDELAPFEYPVTKAYEMTSCFDGTLEYYLATGDEFYKNAVIKFADRILETDFTVIGCAGCSDELFDHSTVRQANTNNEKIMQETCVTVTLMKFFYRLYLLTGESKYVDAFERSFYNAYLGAFNTEKRLDPSILEDHPDWIAEPLPFDSYSPLTAGRRGVLVGGLRVMSDMHYYGCCACIGSLGVGLFPNLMLHTVKDGYALNLFEKGSVTTVDGVAFEIDTAYPAQGNVIIKVLCDTEKQFALSLRNPAWSKTTKASVNGEAVAVTDGYIRIDRAWKNGDTVVLELDMRTEVIRPIPYGEQIIMTNVIWGVNYVKPVIDHEDPLAKRHIALRRGPLMLAQENRLGYSVDDPSDVLIGADGYVDTVLESGKAPYASMLEASVPLADGGRMLLTDYASAGKLWNDESRMAVWILTK